MKSNQVFVEYLGQTSYPTRNWFFAPGERYPEAPFPEVSPEKNDAYDGVRSLFRDMGLDRGRYGTPEWNPLKDVIPPGASVFIKADLIHQLNSEGDISCILTHGSVLRALCDYIVLAGGPGTVLRIGDSPISGADFQGCCRGAGLDLLSAFYGARGIVLEAVDFRVRTLRTSGLAPTSVTIPLDHMSLHALSPRREMTLRATSLDSTPPAGHPGNGQHRYEFARELLEADVVFHVAKLKTHRKAGLAGAIMGSLGMVANRDELPRFSQGSIVEGGDEYLEPSRTKTIVNRLRQVQFSSPSEKVRWMAERLTNGGRRLAEALGADPYVGGSWYGNDTIWRTALDLNRILVYADLQGNLGAMSNGKRIFTILDGLLAGEKDGPTVARPNQCGLLLAGINPVAVDTVAARLTGFDHLRLPSIRNAYGLDKRPLAGFTPDHVQVLLQGRKVALAALPVIPLEPHEGWLGGGV